MSDQQKRDLFSYSGHLSIINIFSTASQYIDKVVLFHFLGAVEVAAYGLALAFPERIRGYTKSITTLILPKLSEKTIDDIAPVFYHRVLQSAVIGALLCLCYVVTVPFVFRLFLPQYLESIRYSQVISLGLIITLPASYMSSVFRSQKMLRTIYWSSTVAHISRIMLFIIFGAYWGIWGVIYASLLVYILGFFYNFLLWEIELKKHFKQSGLGNVNKGPLSK